MIKKIGLICLFLGISVFLNISCSGSSKSDEDRIICIYRPGDNPNPYPDPDSDPKIWSLLKKSKDPSLSETNIKKMIIDLSSDTSEISFYDGSSSDISIITKDEEDLSSDEGKYSYVYMLGGMKIAGVSGEDYFNMMKLQAKEEGSFKDKETAIADGYEVDGEVTYTISSSTDSEVKYHYKKKTIVSNSNVTYSYYGIASFIELSDDLFAVVNVLDPDKSKTGDEVASLYSISIITGSSDATVYLGMKQKANNHSNHKSSINNMKKFFKEDASRAYKNAKNYADLND